MNRWQRWSIAAGLLLTMVYALPLLLPPAALLPVAPPADASIWERVFPGVPVWWVVGRLLCLGLGTLLLAIPQRGPLSLTLGETRVGEGEPYKFTKGESLLRAAAVLVALALVGCAPWAGLFSRGQETLYFLLLGLPALLLLGSEARRWRPAWRGRARACLFLLILPLLWLAISLPMAWRSPRAASLVDMWVMVDRFDQVASAQHRALADSSSPGHTNAYMMLEGVPLYGPNRLPVSYVGLQVAHLLWGIICAVGIGLVAWRMVGASPAIVAQAVFLFSQYSLASPYSPGPTLIAPLCATGLMVLLFALRDWGSGAALAAFGALAGFSATEPTVVAIAMLLSVLAAYAALRHRPIPWLPLIVATLCGVAAVWPGLPDLATLTAMARKYNFGNRQLAGIVWILFGQSTPYSVAETLSSGRPQPFDLPLGALLAPFAIARMPLRLWGDIWLDPFGAICASLGMVLSMRALLHNRAALLLFLVLAMGLVQGFTSSGDAVSHGRMAAALLPLAIFAAVGFDGLRRALRLPGTTSAVGMVALITLSAVGVFALVNPRLLPSSWQTIALQALSRDGSNHDALFLRHSGPWNLGWLYVERIAALLPPNPLPVARLPEVLAAGSSGPPAAPRVYLWSPGVEEGEAASHELCGRNPGAAIYRMMDESGWCSALAAATHGATWQPALSAARWRVSFCEAELCRDDGLAMSLAPPPVLPWAWKPRPPSALQESAEAQTR